MRGRGGKWKEGLVVCSQKKMGIGITIWEVETGKEMVRIPTCAAPPHGMVCLRNHHLVASQIHTPGSFASGVIFIWPLNKPQAPIRSYPPEAIGPLCCTKDGAYLVGGAPSGHIYIWEVSNGRLHKNWHAHHKALTVFAFSQDDSLLISASEDGMIVVWPMISLLDETNSEKLPLYVSFSTEHTASVRGLLSTSSNSSLIFISSSLDCTCKVWDMITGMPLCTRVFPLPITAIALDRSEKLLFSGGSDGRIFVCSIDFKTINDPTQQIVLEGHKGSITALCFSGSGLISASDDCTACLWDVMNFVIIRRFNHIKGPISNLVVIPESALFRSQNKTRRSNQIRLHSLDKYLKSPNLLMDTITFLPSNSNWSSKQLFTSQYPSNDSMNQQILDLQGGRTVEAIQMKIETSIENRLWVERMTKHVMQINRYLQMRLQDLVQFRVSQTQETVSHENKKKKEKEKRQKINIDHMS